MLSISTSLKSCWRLNAFLNNHDQSCTVVVCDVINERRSFEERKRGKNAPYPHYKGKPGNLILML